MGFSGIRAANIVCMKMYRLKALKTERFVRTKNEFRSVAEAWLDENVGVLAVESQLRPNANYHASSDARYELVQRVIIVY